MSVARLNSAVVLLLAGMFTGQDGLAACSGPPGVAGDQIYNSSYSVMQFCNGTNWINMGGVASNVTAAGASGAIQFNTGNALDADAALTWDTTNDRLGIGTSTPAYNLDVMGSAAISGALSLGGTVSGPTTIGIGTSAASSKAVLDVVSTTKGFLPPRMTTAQRDAISSPPIGLTVYSTSTKTLNYFDGTAWQEALTGYSEADPQVGTLTAEAGPGRRPNGARDSDYRAADHAHGPRNGPFQSIDELHLVMGVSKDLYSQLEPALTVYSGRQFIDPQFAPREALLALPMMSRDAAAATMAARTQSSRGGIIDPAIPLGGRAFTVRAQMPGPTGAFLHEAVVRLTDHPSQPYWVLRWTTRR